MMSSLSIGLLFVVAVGVAYLLPSPYGIYAFVAGAIVLALMLYFNPKYRFFRLASSVAISWLAIRSVPNVVLGSFSAWFPAVASIEGDVPWSFDVAAAIVTLGLAAFDKDVRSGVSRNGPVLIRLFTSQSSSAIGHQSQSVVVGDVTGDGNSVTIVNRASDADFNAKIDQCAGYLKERKPDIAIVLLNQIRRDSWDQLTAREKYRVEANLGHAHNQKDELETAAKHFLEARRYQPNESDAAGLEAIAYHLLGESKRALELANEVLADNPRCLEALVVKIASASEQVPTKKLEEDVPPDLLHDQQVLFALCCAASIRRELENAVEYSRKLLAKAPDDLQFKMSLGSALANLAIDGHVGRREITTAECESLAKETIELLSNVLASEGQTRLTRAHAFYHRGLAQEVLNKPDRAEADLRAGVQERPEDGELNYQLCVFLIRHNKYEQAIEHFDESNCDSSRIDPGLLLSRLLFSRNTPTDRDRAEELLIGILDAVPAPDERLTFEAVELLARELAEAQYEPRARDILQQYASRLEQAAQQSIAAEIDLVTGEVESARTNAKDAFDALTSTTPPVVKYFLGKTLADVGLDDEASVVLKDVVETASIDAAAELLLKTAWNSKDYEFLLSFTAKLRDLGRSTAQSMELEILALEAVREFDDAIARINEFLAAPIDEGFAKYLRLKLSWIGKWLEDESLVTYDLAILPGLEDCGDSKSLSLSAVCGVAHLLVEGPNPNDGFRLAYQLVRQHFNNSLAHQCLIGAYQFGTKTKFPVRSTVDENCAVAISNGATKEIHWRVIESDVPIGPLQEISRESFLTQQMIGKCVGDVIRLREDDLQEETGTIEAILDKVEYRARDSINNWTSRFGNDGFLRSFSFKKPNGELDVDAFFEVQRKLHEPNENSFRIYQNEVPSVSWFARVTGRSLIEAIGFLAASSDCRIQCCSGDVTEKQRADQFIDSDRAIVLSPSTLATLFLLSAHRRISRLPAGCIVSASALDTVRSLRRDPNSRFRSECFAGIRFGKPWLEERTEDQIANGLEELSAFITWLQENAGVCGGRGILSIGRQARERLRESCGTATVESIGTAIEKNAILCIDDPLVTLLEEDHTPVDRIWTSMLLKKMNRASLLDDESYRDFLLQLIACDYRFIPLDQAMVNRAGERARWDSSDAVFRAVIEWLNRSGVVHAAPVAAFIIQRTWAETQLANLRADVLSSVVRSLAKRRDGIASLRQLDSQIRRAFRLQPDTLQQIRNAIRRTEELELASSPIILPGDPDYSIPNFRFK
ncbi:hypothetical protein RB11367 [Rhodopirellula baltica SH 1]|uniref:Uncharacterized protein n=2 Tax=Rhodopirellula baltica TaxID=265606 RepID=Q7UEF6_RHOBA|nr:hypothetical protein RB11367 [Rhodopirellula baltica SH 1]